MSRTITLTDQQSGALLHILRMESEYPHASAKEKATAVELAQVLTMAPHEPEAEPEDLLSVLPTKPRVQDRAIGGGRLFCGIHPGGVSWSDREVLEDGDYKRLAFMPYATLEVFSRADCPDELRAAIGKEASYFEERRGNLFQVSTCGQTVILGRGV